MSTETKWKKVTQEMAPFWIPWKDAKQPKTLVGHVIHKRERTDPKYGSSTIVTVHDDEDGVNTQVYAVDTKTAALVELAKYEVGTLVKIEYKGERKVKNRQMPMHDIELSVADETTPF